MQVSAKAAYFVEVHTLSELKEAVSFGEANNLELLVLGGGSNILFKANFNGLVILNSIRGMSFTSKGDFIHEVKASSGENWHDLVLFCVKKGLAGIENLSLIPGSVGAAPIQNIGAYGVELQDVFLSLEAMMVSTGEIKSFSKEECNFGYRDSIFKNELKGKAIITSVTIQLSTNAKPNTSYKSLSDLLAKKGISNPSIKDVSEAVIEIRKSKLPDPKEIGNTGSFFKNPIISVDHFNQLKSQYPEIPSYPVTERQVKVPAGWLIDKDGWKGKREGEAGVHEKQALVLVNHGNASGKEIWNLASQIRLSIEKRFNISLTPEVNIIG
jgi:UDP-N-acetylmuramate dehydrogenase